MQVAVSPHTAVSPQLARRRRARAAARAEHASRDERGADRERSEQTLRATGARELRDKHTKRDGSTDRVTHAGRPRVQPARLPRRAQGLRRQEGADHGPARRLHALLIRVPGPRLRCGLCGNQSSGARRHRRINNSRVAFRTGRQERRTESQGDRKGVCVLRQRRGGHARLGEGPEHRRHRIGDLLG